MTVSTLRQLSLTGSSWIVQEARLLSGDVVPVAELVGSLETRSKDVE